MSEDRFFQNIRSAMVEYSPEVPHSVYSGMRKKLWWSNFTRISITRFNIWYAALIVTSATIWMNFNHTEAPTMLENQPAAQTEMSDVVSEDFQLTTAPNTEPSVQSYDIKTESTAPKPILTNESPAVNPKEKPAEVSSGMVDEVKVSEPVTSNEPSSGEKKDSSLIPGKAVKKGLKVKTFQSTDK